MQQIQEIELEWFQIRLVHRIFTINVVLMHMGIEMTLLALFVDKNETQLTIYFGHVR